MLMNNSVFDKTLENIRNMVDIRLISSDKAAQKLAAYTLTKCLMALKIKNVRGDKECYKRSIQFDDNR